MTVRLKLTLTLFATGLVTALAVIATVVLAFQRFENETTYQRANVFLGRVVDMYDSLFDMHQRHPQDFNSFLRNLVLFEPDSQLYLLAPDGTVLARTGDAPLPPGFKVKMDPVRQAASQPTSPYMYVMGDDPERMDANAVIAARAVRRSVIHASEPVAGYLYLVCHKNVLPQGRWQVLRETFGRPAMGLIAGIVAFTTLLAALVVASVTRPLRRLTKAVAQVSAQGLQAGIAAPAVVLPAVTRDEFGLLTQAFATMLLTLRKQWDTLRRLDHFRREAISNLSHDLRSPLTATTACLETLEARWLERPVDDGQEDRRLIEVALRNSRNAARLVQSLGDLATLDEPTYPLQIDSVDVHELLDDIALRFAARAAQQGVLLNAQAGPSDHSPVSARVDVELFERAIANLVDNALKFSGAGGRVTLSAATFNGRAEVSVSDTGRGIAADDLPHLFDRFYQARQHVAPATGEGGKGLGLAIVKRIAELHGGGVEVRSTPEQGTQVRFWVSANP